MKKIIFSIVLGLCLASTAQAQVTLQVPFKAQVPPGSWSSTSNCGQASINMAIAYLQGVPADENGIRHIDEFLAKAPYRRSLNSYNSQGTRPWMLLDVARVYADMPKSFMDTNWDLVDIKEQLDNGLPVVCRVSARYLTNRGYSYTGGHYILAIGYDSTAIICHDPGTTSGAFKHYSNSDFTKAHNTRTDQAEWEPGAVVIAVPDSGGVPPGPPTGLTFKVTIDGVVWEVPKALYEELEGWLEDNGTVLDQ